MWNHKHQTHAVCLRQRNRIATVNSQISLFLWNYSHCDTCRRLTDPIMHLHTCLRSMEETLDQTRLINYSWETVAQPSCLQPQTPTTSGMLNTHTSRHIQHTLYKHNDSDMQELIFYHNGGILLVQNCWHKLAASEQAGCLPKCCMCGASERWKASTVTLPQRLRFTRHRRLGKFMWHFERLYGQSFILGVIQMFYNRNTTTD